MPELTEAERRQQQQEHFAVIYAPRQNRQRFPENCVQPHPTAATARDAAQPDRNQYAAKVAGPFRSSEGFMLYYLVEWLE